MVNMKEENDTEWYVEAKFLSENIINVSIIGSTFCNSSSPSYADVYIVKFEECRFKIEDCWGNMQDIREVDIIITTNMLKFISVSRLSRATKYYLYK